MAKTTNKRGVNEMENDESENLDGIGNKKAKLDDSDQTIEDSKEKVKLKVGEVVITANLEDLRSQPETMLGKMFTSGMAQANELGEYEVHNVEPNIIEGFLDYYTNGRIKIPKNASYGEMQAASDYLLIPFSFNTVDNCQSFLQIKAEYSKRKLIDNLFETVVIPHLDYVAANGKNDCDVYLIRITDRPYCKPNSTPPYLSTSFQRFYIEDNLFDIIWEYDQKFSYVTSLMTSKGFSVDFEKDTYKNIAYIGCTFHF